MFPVQSTVHFGVSLALTRMLIPARTWDILALRLLLLLVVVQIMVMQQRLNPTLLPNITTRPSNTASDCAGTFSVRATVVDHHTTVDQ